MCIRDSGETEEQKTGNLVSVKDAREDIEKALDALRDGGYSNLSGDLSFVQFPEAVSFSSIQLIYGRDEQSILEYAEEAKGFFSQFQDISSTSNIHSDTATFISAGAQDFISVGTITPTFTARLSCDGNAGAFGYIGIKSVIN